MSMPRVRQEKGWRKMRWPMSPAKNRLAPRGGERGEEAELGDAQVLGLVDDGGVEGRGAADSRREARPDGAPGGQASGLEVGAGGGHDRPEGLALGAADAGLAAEAGDGGVGLAVADVPGVDDVGPLVEQELGGEGGGSGGLGGGEGGGDLGVGGDRDRADAASWSSRARSGIERTEMRSATSELSPRRRRSLMRRAAARVSVKVVRRTRAAGSRRARWAARWRATTVLPVPAEPETRAGPVKARSTKSRCEGWRKTVQASQGASRAAWSSALDSIRWKRRWASGWAKGSGRRRARPRVGRRWRRG